MTYPNIDPIALSLGPLHIRWYALAYLAAFLIGWAYATYWARKNPFRPNAADLDEYIPYLVMGVVLGGRIGYILFYQFPYFMENPLDMLKVWHGGMSFHGGLLGVVISVLAFTKIKKIPTLAMGDLCCAATPPGLFLGRIANFVNGELWGRPTNSETYGMVFPHVDYLPRHPSQLYEAGLEGILLFFVLFLLIRKAGIRARHGLIMGVFLIGYGLCRVVGELFREPDEQLGYLFGGLTMGQILCIPLFVIGIALIIRAVRRPPYQSVDVTA